ncbi:activating signal cointegrator 1 complex subunit [Stylosanthes scabra]|uniref:Activating signal cointegrator 1 complex subunit n=1 Tax=Stylosanthes scabra TaxID=79078 RepID=A0ABU6ZWU0_9FABA|nr:activating signal cointegrator 1 complex subunit [Stylosanthes scabra]
MLPCMNADLMHSLSRSGIFSVKELLDIPKASLQNVTGSFPASRLYQDLQHFPRVRTKLKLQKKETNGESSDALYIRLEKSNSRRHSSRAFVPRFPKIKEEQWWLVLGNTSTSELYALKRVSFSDHLVTSMKLPQTIPNLQGMKLILVSDCYIGFEQEHSIEGLIGSRH